MKKQLLVGLLLLLGFTTVTGAQTQPSAAAAHVWVSKDFVQQVLVDEEAAFKDQNVMDVLREHTELKTDFAGGFVSAINGIPAHKDPRSKQNWFYYVNGTFSLVGALTYFPKDGDVIWWDYHRWDDAAYVSAVIGAYPHPFKGGYNNVIAPTKVVSTAAFSDKAQALAESLRQQDVKDASAVPYAGDIQKFEQDYVILVASWDEIKQDKKVMDLFANYKKTGAFVRFDQDGATALDITGKPAGSYGQAGCILALAGGFQQTPPVWLVTGTDQESIGRALDILIKTPEQIKYYAGVLATPKGLVHVPVAGKEQ